jgi:hypothetical protein
VIQLIDTCSQKTTVVALLFVTVVQNVKLPSALLTIFPGVLTNSLPDPTGWAWRTTLPG